MLNSDVPINGQATTNGLIIVGMACPSFAALVIPKSVPYSKYAHLGYKSLKLTQIPWCMARGLF